LDEPVTSIGREQECGLVLNYPQVSRLHARVERADSGYAVVDCESTNGTWVNGTRLDEPRSLGSGDQIGMGDVAITFLDESPEGLRAALEHALALARGETGDSQMALPLIDDVIDTADALGMADVAEYATEVEIQVRVLSAADPGASDTTVGATVFFQAPDLRHFQAPDGTVTILFTDIEDSTPLTDRLGDRRWMELLRRHNAIIRRHVSEHGGFEVKGQGDGFMIAFKSPREAILSAVAIQRAFAAYNDEAANETVRVRIGLHTGEAIRDRADFYGKNVIIATRVTAQASGGEILVSAPARTLTEVGGDIEFGEGREVGLKGLPGLHTVFPVSW